MPRGIYQRSSPEERFWSKVEKTNSCWNWKSSKQTNGYGQFGFNGKHILSHRFAYELFNDPIPQELDCHHTCNNKVCVNPEHIILVTPKEHIFLTPNNAPKQEKAKTHCPQGHEYNVENTRIGKTGYRVCRACHRERECERNWWKRQK